MHSRRNLSAWLFFRCEQRATGAIFLPDFFLDLAGALRAPAPVLFGGTGEEVIAQVRIRSGVQEFGTGQDQVMSDFSLRRTGQDQVR